MKDWSSVYSGQVDTPGSTYPWGEPRNRSAPGATDGTPLEEAWVADFWGFFQAILTADGGTPSGNCETAQTSQIFDALRRIKSGFYWYVLTGAELQVQSGGLVSILAGGTQTVSGTLNIADTATQEVLSGGFINVNDGGIVHLKDGAILDVLDGAEVIVLSGGQLRSDAGSTVQLNGYVNITGETHIASGTEVTFDGTANYPKLGTRSEWLPCRGCYGTPTPSNYSDVGWNVEVLVDTSQVEHYRVAVPGHYTISQVKVQWIGATHSTFPPENRAVFSVYKVDNTGASTLLGTQADTSAKSTYEVYHSVTISGFSETFGPEEYMLIAWFNEYGTNAEAGGKWLSSQMYATFAELRNT